MRRHVEGHRGEAALDQRRDDGRELRAVALEAMDQQDDRSLRPSARQPGRRRDRCAGRRAAATAPAAAARGGADSASCGGRTAPPARARRGWRRQGRRSAGEERTCRAPISAVAPIWAVRDAPLKRRSLRALRNFSSCAWLPCRSDLARPPPVNVRSARREERVHDQRRIRRHHRARLHAGRGRAACHDAAGAARRRRHQDRAAGRRLGPRAGRAQGRSLRPFRRLQPRQALDRARPQVGRRQGRREQARWPRPTSSSRASGPASSRGWASATRTSRRSIPRSSTARSRASARPAPTASGRRSTG